jgi:drug/metabolite transporter (DMT)-like permease
MGGGSRGPHRGALRRGQRVAGPVPWPPILLLVLAVAWGSSFLFIKLAVASLPPLTVSTGRIIIAAAILVALALVRGERFPAGRANWVTIALIGAVGQVIPFVLIGIGETRIESGLAAILIATVPLGTMVIAHVATADDRLTARKALGAAAGLAGIVVLVGPGALSGLGAEVVGQLAVLGAALSYAVTNVAAHRVRHLPPTVLSASSALAAVAWSIPATVLIDRPWTLTPTAESVGAVIALALFSTALGSLAYFHLVRLAGGSFASMTNFAIPLVAVGLGIAFLGERPSWQALAALLLVLAGIAAVLRRRSER